MLMIRKEEQSKLNSQRKENKRTNKLLLIELEQIKLKKEELESNLVNLISKRETSEELMLTYISRGKDLNYSLFEYSFAVDMSTLRSIDNIKKSFQKKDQDQFIYDNKEHILLDDHGQSFLSDLKSHLVEWDKVYDYDSSITLFQEWIELSLTTNNFYYFIEKVIQLVLNNEELNDFISKFIYKYTNWFIYSRIVDNSIKEININLENERKAKENEFIIVKDKNKQLKIEILQLCDLIYSLEKRRVLMK